MADYPWGAVSPQKRITALEALIKGNDDKRSAAVEAHRKKIVEFDEADKGFRADLKVATGIAERERKESNKSEAVRILERLAGGGFDLEAALKSGLLEKHLQSAVETAVAEAANAPAKGAAKAAPKAKKTESEEQEPEGNAAGGTPAAAPTVTPAEA